MLVPLLRKFAPGVMTKRGHLKLHVRRSFARRANEPENNTHGQSLTRPRIEIEETKGFSVTQSNCEVLKVNSVVAPDVCCRPTLRLAHIAELLTTTLSFLLSLSSTAVATLFDT